MTINYGVFVNTIITFLIVAFAIFMMVKNINRWKQEEEAPPAEPTTKKCDYCDTEIPIAASAARTAPRSCEPPDRGNRHLTCPAARGWGRLPSSGSWPAPCRPAFLTNPLLQCRICPRLLHFARSAILGVLQVRLRRARSQSPQPPTSTAFRSRPVRNAARLRAVKATPNDRTGRHDQPRLRQEPRRQRGDAGRAREPRASDRQRSGGGRDGHRQHLRLCRGGQAGVDRRDPRGGARQGAEPEAACWSPAAWSTATAASWSGRSPRSTASSASTTCGE